jgi:hypothetical protein
MSEYIGRNIAVEIGGRKYVLSRFTRKVLRAFLDWADKELGDPLEAVKGKLAGFPPNIQELMVREAIQAAKLRRSVDSPEVQALMQRPEGVMKILALLFQANHPELTDRDVEALFDQAAQEHGENYLERKILEASGQIPKDEDQTTREFLDPDQAGEKKG